MVQMRTESVLADCYGVSIVGIPRRYVADIHFSHFSLFRYCTRYTESRNSDTTMNENKCHSTRSHLFLFMITCKASPNQADRKSNPSDARTILAVNRPWTSRVMGRFGIDCPPDGLCERPGGSLQDSSRQAAPWARRDRFRAFMAPNGDSSAGGLTHVRRAPLSSFDNWWRRRES